MDDLGNWRSTAAAKAAAAAAACSGARLGGLRAVPAIPPDGEIAFSFSFPNTAATI